MSDGHAQRQIKAVAETGRRLRILHLVISIGETNAAYNQFCLPVADEREVTLCTYFTSRITPSRKVRVFEGDNTLRGFVRALRAALEASEYDIVQAHSPHVALLFLAASGFIHAAGRCSTVMVVHDSFCNYKLRNRVMLALDLAGFDRVVCCSHASGESFPRVWRRLAGDRLRVVPNGLDVSRVDCAAAKARPSIRGAGALTIAAVSRLVAIKNPLTVLKCVAASGGAAKRLVYIGDGPLRSTLIDESAALALEHRVHFTGLIPRDEVYQHLLDADLFISTSRGEGLPVSVLEAMACACPVLLSDIPPHREIAAGTDFIPLVDADDVDGFAHAIRKFSALEPRERAVIGRKCSDWVRSRFSLDAMHRGYRTIYAELSRRAGAAAEAGRREVNQCAD